MLLILCFTFLVRKQPLNSPLNFLKENPEISSTFIYLLWHVMSFREKKSTFFNPYFEAATPPTSTSLWLNRVDPVEEKHSMKKQDDQTKNNKRKRRRSKNLRGRNGRKNKIRIRWKGAKTKGLGNVEK